MKLYSITNGYMGEGIVKVLVCADSEKRALELAKGKFKEGVKKDSQYGKDYYSNLVVLDVFDNLSKEWVSEVNQLDNH